MKYLNIFLFLLLFFTKTLGAETAYQHFNTDELKLANNLIKSLKNGNTMEYSNYLKSRVTLERALNICKHGLQYRLLWDDNNQRFYLGENTKKFKSNLKLDFILFFWYHTFHGSAMS